MANISVSIDGQSYIGPRPVMELLLDVSLERDKYKEIVMDREKADLKERNDQIRFMRRANGLDEWECPECSRQGQYQEIRKPFDRGADSCPECGTEVDVIEFD